MRVSTKGQWLRSAAAVLIVMVMSILSPIGTGLASAQVKLEAIIYNACRIAGDPYAFTGTGYEDLAPSDLVGFGIGFNNAVGKFWGTSLRASQLKFASDDLHFTYRTQDSRTMPQAPILFQWDMVYLSDILNTGSFKLGAPGTCGTATIPPVGSVTTTVSSTGPVRVQVIVGGILRDQLSGDFSPQALKETLKKGVLIGVSGQAVLQDSNGNPGTANWSLNRVGASKSWKGSVRIGDQSMHIASAFGRTIKVSLAKGGQISGSASARVKNGGATGVATLRWKIA